MSQLITVSGMILSVMPVGEYDKRVVILSKERGKITAFAKGARRPQNHLSGVTAPCVFGEFSLYEGRNSYTIHSADISHYFAELRTDVEAAYYAFYFLEFADYFAKEGNDERELLKLLFQTIRVTARRVLPLELVRSVYELKAIVINGEGPQVFQCVGCGAKDSPSLFSVRAGGLLCEKCRNRVIDGEMLHTSTIYAMQFVVTSSIEKLYTFCLSEDVQREFDRVVECYKEVYIGRRFKSFDILKQLTELC